MKKVFQWSLLAIVAVGIIAGVMNRQPIEEVPASSPPTQQQAESSDVVVTYFTTDVRCKKCLNIEALTKDALVQNFEDQLNSGKIQFRVINTDESNNQHYIEDYQLAFKTVVISHQNTDGKTIWTKMDKVWELLDNPEAFITYISEGVTTACEQTS